MLLEELKLKIGNSGLPHSQPELVMVLHCKDVGPSGVRALLLAAGINVGGHYKWHYK